METGHPQCQSAILSIGTAVPPYRMEQAAIARWISDSFGPRPALNRWVKRIYDHSGITYRYSCRDDAFRPPQESPFAPGTELCDNATTEDRMAIYERESVRVGTAAARQAIESYSSAEGSEPADVADSITHVIAVSCTGFFAPGLDQMIARQLELRPQVERTIVGFMGCAAAFNALRLADQIVRGRPEARVLIVCVELCTLHLQQGHRSEDLIVGALFSDGASACLVGRPRPEQHDVFEIQRFYTELTPETESFMVWRIGNHGYKLHLSTEIPAQLAGVAPVALQTLFAQDIPELSFWAIHPGGRAILDNLAEIFALAPNYLEPSRETLRSYGNVSSATILFVLQAYRRRLRKQAAGSRLDGVAMAFGPGLVTELAHLVYRVGDTTAVAPETERVT